VEGKKNLSAQSAGARVAKYELDGRHVASYWLVFARKVTVAQPSRNLTPRDLLPERTALFE